MVSPSDGRLRWTGGRQLGGRSVRWMGAGGSSADGLAIRPELGPSDRPPAAAQVAAGRRCVHERPVMERWRPLDRLALMAIVRGNEPRRTIRPGCASAIDLCNSSTVMYGQCCVASV